MHTLTPAPRTVRKDITLLDRGDGVRLALHRWTPPEPRAAVLYFHGLQSHAGWLWEAGPRYAEQGVAFFVLDRRGSGISDGARGEIPDADTVLDDYAAALGHLRATVGEALPLGLFGHCLGGSFLAALLHHRALTVAPDSVLFCSAPLGRMHATFSAEQRARLTERPGDGVWEPGLAAADFSDLARYRDFIDGDDLAVRTLTHRSRAVLLDLERLYVTAEGTLKDVPAAYVSGHRDPVVDLEQSRHVFARLTARRGRIRELPTDKHYLYFTDVRDELIAWSAAFLGGERAGHDG
ncbi:alpha/beta fold hydrolase [Streptomyces sp. NPDC038707]|uniref:alpha/beta hydrolase n=1 Tax=Streptomyces sp. NPDC038707 TaxID=3154329 RepID=UPI0033E0B5ED